MATAPKPKREPIELPECGVKAFLQSPKLSERARLIAMEGVDAALNTLASTVVDEKGQPIWSVEEWDVFSGANQDRFKDFMQLSYRLSGLRLVEEPAEEKKTPAS